MMKENKNKNTFNVETNELVDRKRDKQLKVVREQERLPKFQSKYKNERTKKLQVCANAFKGKK